MFKERDIEYAVMGCVQILEGHHHMVHRCTIIGCFNKPFYYCTLALFVNICNSAHGSLWYRTVCMRVYMSAELPQICVYLLRVVKHKHICFDVGTHILFVDICRLEVPSSLGSSTFLCSLSPARPSFRGWARPCTALDF